MNGISINILDPIFKESGEASDTLQFAEVEILEDEACIIPYNKMTGKELFHPNTMICAGVKKVTFRYKTCHVETLIYFDIKGYVYFNFNTTTFIYREESTVAKETVVVHLIATENSSVSLALV